jgi:hypothetical protein
MEATVGGVVFFSNFDSGNLGRVEPAEKRRNEDDDETSAGGAANEEAAACGSVVQLDSDAEFNLWTRPDCDGSEFENGNRTWFYFGIRHCSNGAPANLPSGPCTLRLNIRNLNKQSKLFSQGMTPITVSVPLPKAAKGGSGAAGTAKVIQPPNNLHWDRIRERPTYWTEDNNFALSFRVNVSPRSVTYVSFTYPYSYRELQAFLGRLDKKHGSINPCEGGLLRKPAHTIYFHREMVCLSYEGRKIDLLTVTSLHGVTDEREDRLESLFPNADCERPFKFENKKIVFVSARVHPGETQSSFVLNGFVKFILRESDPRAAMLRRKYVFKLIPMLNPDGVFKGHYRTDCRGINLNRIYSKPSFSLHPPIYAARKLLLYAHHGYEVFESEAVVDQVPGPSKQEEVPKMCEPPPSPGGPSRWLRSSEPEVSISPRKREVSPMGGLPVRPPDGWYEMTETSRCSEGDESIADFSVSGNVNRVIRPPPFAAAALGSEALTERTSFAGAFSAPANPVQRSNVRRVSVSSSGAQSLEGGVAGRMDLSAAGGEEGVAAAINPPDIDLETNNANLEFAKKLSDTIAKEAEQPKSEGDGAKESGLLLYVDIHGHASKRGIFMYGNHFSDVDTKVSSMLLPKLMSINCANFDFPACNFTEKNMYMKDRHTGAGRDGSGRVSCFKATGLVKSYTLECNFNTGRVVNTVPPASRDCGRATPPPPAPVDFPPKYNPDIYEDSGKAMAISILDLTESNPWTRLTSSPCKTLKGVKDAIRKYIRLQGEEQAKAKLKAGSSTASPARSTRGRRTRTISTASVGKKVVVMSAAPPATSKSAPGSAGAMKGTPGSPDSYRPVSKIPRKGSISAKNSQGGGSLSSLDTTGKSSLGTSAPGRSAKSLRRSKSIPAGGGLNQAVIQQIVVPAAAAAVASATASQDLSRKSSSGNKQHLTRSQSASAPGSRSTSPRRALSSVAPQKRLSTASADAKKKRKKKPLIVRTGSVGTVGATSSGTMAPGTEATAPRKKKTKKVLGGNITKKRKISASLAGGSGVVKTPQSASTP